MILKIIILSGVWMYKKKDPYGAVCYLFVIGNITNKRFKINQRRFINTQTDHIATEHRQAVGGECSPLLLPMMITN